MTMAKQFIAIACLLAATPLNAQDPVPGQLGAVEGSGEFPAIAEARADAPGYTIYRPSELPDAKIPLVLWGNGACRDNGLSASHFLREIASHGYFVIANGSPREEYPVSNRYPPLKLDMPPVSENGAMVPPNRPKDETSVNQLLAAIDWAKNRDARTSDPFFGHIDTDRIAVLGHSCGGLQALAAGADPRIDTVIAFASGVYVTKGRGLSGVGITKSDLEKLHTPVAYILGGPDDIAYSNGMDDFEVIQHLPVITANLPVGHLGTFRLRNGGDWARVGVNWLDWQIKGDQDAGKWFVGAACRLCTSYGWTVQRKNMPEAP